MELIHLSSNSVLKRKIRDVNLQFCPYVHPAASFLPKALFYSFIHTFFLWGVLLLENKADGLQPGPDESHLAGDSEESNVAESAVVCISSQIFNI